MLGCDDGCLLGCLHANVNWISFDKRNKTEQNISTYEGCEVGVSDGDDGKTLGFLVGGDDGC